MTEPTDRKTGTHFVPEKNEDVVPITRQARQFIPDEKAQLTLPPEAISAHETLDHLPAYSGLRLEKMPWKGLSFFVGCGLLLVVLLAAWQVYDVYQQALAAHWVLAASFLALVAALTGSALLLTWQFLAGRERSGNLDTLRTQAARILEGHDKGAAKAFIELLEEHYQDKPQYVFLKRSLASLPDYSNDQEALLHLERTFLEPLDKEAARRVSNFSLQTAAAVTISPWAVVDMALALWRMVKMVDEVGQVYGIRPSLAGRWRLLKKIALQLVYVGASEVAMENTFDELGNDALGGLLAARGLQGLGAGIYSVRVGICAMKICRPIAFSADKTPRFSAVAGDMLAELKRIIKRRI